MIKEQNSKDCGGETGRSVLQDASDIIPGEVSVTAGLRTYAARPPSAGFGG